MMEVQMVNVVTVGAAFTNNLTVNLDADVAANKVDAAAYTKVLTVVAEAILTLPSPLLLVVLAPATDQIHHRR